MRQGWPANQLYFLRSGYVDLVMNKAVVDTLRDGDFFGEAALMELPSEEDLQRVRCSLPLSHTSPSRAILDRLQRICQSRS